MKQPGVDERFVLLETKLSYFEKTSSELNEVIIAQGRELEQLRLRLEALERQLRGLDEGGPMPHERPPHY